MMNPPSPRGSRMRGPSRADMRDVRDLDMRDVNIPSTECSLSVLNLPPYRLAALSQVKIRDL